METSKKSRPAGFYDVPGNPYVWVARDGRCLNPRTGNALTPVVQANGYKTITVFLNNTTKTFYHHRLLALAFLLPPKRHQGKSFDELEVNHMDGDTANNNLLNLEWVTPEENIEHAIRNGFTNHEVVLARDIRSNEVKRYPNVTDCAKVFGIGVKRLRRHLSSKLMGYITQRWHVFKLQSDPRPWPELREEHMQESTWERQFGVWVAESVENDTTVLGNTLAELCQAVGLSPTAAQTFLHRNPAGTPYLGWLICFDDTSLQSGIDQTRRFKDRLLFPAKEIKVTHLASGEESFYASRNLAAAALALHPDRIRYALKAKDGMVDGYRFVEHEPQSIMEIKTAIQ